MSLIPATAVPFTGEDYLIEHSLRFEFGDSAYLSRTTTSTGSNYIATLSAWVKRAKNGVRQTFFAGWESASERMNCYFLDDCLTMQIFTGGTAHDLKSNAVFRDPSAWYHVVFQFNTSSGTESERFKMFVNGVQVTSFAVDDTIGQNIEMKMWGSTSQVTLVGAQKGSSVGNYFDGYMAEVHIIDGTVYAPSEFGETGDYGEWKPKEVSGLTYGTNGCYLSFAGGGVMSVTGGNSTATDGDYKAASFTADGTFTPSADGYVEYLVIAGGGGAGNTSGGGGGAGGYRTGYLPVTGSTAYSITVGDGGAGGGIGGDGDNSVFSTITSTGGGGGGGWNGDGRDGGSGGGGGGRAVASGGSGTAGQGYDGAASDNHSTYGGSAGGGGAGAVGQGNREKSGAGWNHGGHGGAGLTSSITGSSVTRAGGGGGGGDSGGEGGTGGSGGGGNGSGSNHGPAAGTANTGSGGGGGGNGGGADEGGEDGGSGIVILRYKFQ